MGLHLCSLRNLSSFYDSLNSSPGILTESDFSLSYSSPCQPNESDLSLACHFQNRSPVTWIPHITYVQNKVSNGIGIMFKARHYLKGNALVNLYNSFIYPYLIYCIEAWGNATNCHLKQL